MSRSANILAVSTAPPASTLAGFSFSPVRSATVTSSSLAMATNFSYGGELGLFAILPIYPFEKPSFSSSLVKLVFFFLHRARMISTVLALSTKIT
nr:MAG TPA: hypothetical protein [Caudoviricetes sp.]